LEVRTDVDSWIEGEIWVRQIRGLGIPAPTRLLTLWSSGGTESDG
jgi:hypothetical protein